jgi:hypothetical protein
MKTLPRVASEMALHVLAYNLIVSSHTTIRQDRDASTLAVKRFYTTKTHSVRLLREFDAVQKARAGHPDLQPSCKTKR